MISITDGATATPNTAKMILIGHPCSLRSNSLPGAPIRNANAIASARPAPHLIAFATKLV